jgi:hypothetical protein
MRVDTLIIEHHAVEVLPNPFVAGATQAAVDGGLVLVDATAARGVLQMRTEAARFATAYKALVTTVT